MAGGWDRAVYLVEDKEKEKEMDTLRKRLAPSGALLQGDDPAPAEAQFSGVLETLVAQAKP